RCDDSDLIGGTLLLNLRLPRPTGEGLCDRGIGRLTRRSTCRPGQVVGDEPTHQGTVKAMASESAVRRLSFVQRTTYATVVPEPGGPVSASTRVADCAEPPVARVTVALA